MCKNNNRDQPREGQKIIFVLNTSLIMWSKSNKEGGEGLERTWSLKKASLIIMACFNDEKKCWLVNVSTKIPIWQEG